MTAVITRSLDEVLRDLVAHDVLTTEQAHAVLDGVGAPSGPGTPELGTEIVTPATVPAAPAPHAGRNRLVEAAAYLGAILVGASALAFLVQIAEDLTEGQLSLLLAGCAALAGVAALVVSLTCPGGTAALREPVHAARRRLASTLLTLTAALLGGSIALALRGVVTQDMLAVSLAAACALVVLVAAQRLVPSALTEIGLLASTGLALASGLTVLVPERPYLDEFYDVVPAARPWDYLVPLAMVVLGLAWAAGVSRLLTIPVLAEALGCLLALQYAVPLAAEMPTRPAGLAVLGVLAVVGVAMSVLVRDWPWIMLAVLATTAAVFVLVAELGNPALAFLVSGLVLLACAGAAAWWMRRRAEHRQAAT